ncbi:hypothetical protein [Paraclostridium bifermentans]
MSNEAEIVKEHIIECEDALFKQDTESMRKLGTRMLSIYRLKVLSINRWRAFEPTIENMERLISALKLYKGELIDRQSLEALKQQKISLNASVHNSGNSTNTNTNNNNLDIKTMFEDARKSIEDDEALGEEEIKEIICKINEIEEVGNEDISKPKKWRKLKGCVNWMSTKGVKVATTLMPIMMKMLEDRN